MIAICCKTKKQAQACFFVLFLFMLKEREVYASISYVTYKAGMLLEIVVLAMLKDKETALLQHVALHYKLGNVGKSF